MKGSSKIIGVALILLVLGSVGYTVYSSYNSLHFSIQNISVTKIELKPNWETLFYAITGNLILAALSTVYSVDLNIAIKIHNSGFLPLVIPSFDYDLYGNNIYVGSGKYQNEITINPGSAKTIYVTLKITISEMKDLLWSIVNNEGKLNVEIKGESQLSFLPINIPFHFTKSINIYQEVQNKIRGK